MSVLTKNIAIMIIPDIIDHNTNYLPQRQECKNSEMTRRDYSIILTFAHYRMHNKVEHKNTD